MRKSARIALIWSAATLAAQPTMAGTVVVPNVTANNGNAANSDPFNLGAGASERYQQVYDSYLFTPAFNVPELITQLAFRTNGLLCQCATTFSATLPDVQIDLSTTQSAAGALSTTYSANVGADDTVVFDGALALSSAGSGRVPPGTFDILIPLQTPFLYDPNAGNLLFDVRVFDGATTVPFDAEFDFLGFPNGTSRITGALGSATGFADSGVAGGLITQFTFTAVPESSTGLLLLTGLFGMAIVARARRNGGL